MERMGLLEKRLAWTRPRHVDTAEDSFSFSMTEFTFQDLDNAFLDEGMSADRISGWLQDCSSPIENSSEEVLQHPKVLLCKGNSLEDEFTLGAEATHLSDHHRNRLSHTYRMFPDHPLKTMHMGESMTSTSTAKTSSSISEILTQCQGDPESILYNLGFASEKTCSEYVVPTRFFLCPSQAMGIDFRLYVQSQLHRMNRGDSSYIPSDYGVLRDTLCTFHNLYPNLTRTSLKNATYFGHWTSTDQFCMNVT
ncbi:protein TESPA1 [Hyperolius riggenbachi]|uniref:protein TESPA1 n=1 Tax=Hyperolius riggenbachi TaxID=752182 RepID=UPI0035A3C48B